MAEESATATRPSELTRIKNEFARMVTKDPKKTTFYVCKVIEVIFCVIAIGLSSYPFHEYKIRKMFLDTFTNAAGATVFTSLYGYTLINIVLLISHVLGEEHPKKLLLIFSGVATILCLTTGILLIVEIDKHEHDIIPAKYLDELLPSGILAILASLTFALDTLLTYKYA